MYARNYTISPVSPRPMSGESYGVWLETEWHKLLGDNPREQQIQAFLEQHPALVPGAFGAAGLSSGHAPFPGALISQPTLYGYQSRRPDFMWISKNSSFLNPVLIEIESPQKKLFTRAGIPTAEFTQARNQLAEWKAWLSIPENQQTFLRAYGLSFPSLKFEPHYVLVYGRRAEFEHDERLRRVRAELMGTNEHLMSFDRLTYEPKANQMLTVRHTATGYDVLHVPPTYWLGPSMFHYEMPLAGRVAAADRNPLISDERKTFMRQRIPYWETWDRGPKGIISTGDRE